MKLYSAILALGSATLLAACGSTGNAPAASDNTQAGANTQIKTRSANAQTNARSANAQTNTRSASTCQVVRDDMPGKGRNVLYKCDGAAVLRSDAAKAALHSEVSFHFGNSGSVIRANLTSRQAANRFGHSDEAACERAFINAAKKFQETTIKHNGRRVSNFHSALHHKTLSGGQYHCEVGTFHARVLMRGNIAR